VIGGVIPDYRGLFLRGFGGNAASLGQIQQDAGRNATVTFHSVDGNIPYWGYPEDVTGVFSATQASRGREDGVNPESLVTLDLSRAWCVEHTATEFRPINRSVRYMTR
jgi:hypothetical protein